MVGRNVSSNWFETPATGHGELFDVDRLEVRAVHDQFDVTLEDDDLLGEVELTTTLIIAASESDEHLTQEEIDRLLGVTPVPPGAEFPLPRPREK